MAMPLPWTRSSRANAPSGESVVAKTGSTLKPEAIPEELLFHQTVLDTESRTAAAIPFYVLIWLALATGGGLAKTAPLWLLFNAIGFLGVAAARIVVHLLIKRALDVAPKAANFALCGVILSNGLYWGCLTAASLVQPWGTTMWWGMLAMAYALAAAGSSVMAINPILRRSFPAAVLLPIVYCIFVEVSDRNLRIVEAIPLLFIYTISSSAAVRKDYRDALIARKIAEIEAKTFERLSTIDALTGLANRLAFDAALEREWRKAAKTGARLSILMVDLDHFKRINDTYGHLFGDRCLAAAARALERSVRRGDFVFRYGGEEFAVLLIDADDDGAMLTATRCLENMRTTPLGHQDGTVALACSIGVALKAACVDGDRMDLVQSADNALYKAKREGRDRACLSEVVTASGA